MYTLLLSFGFLKLNIPSKNNKIFSKFTTLKMLSTKIQTIMIILLELGGNSTIPTGLDMII